MLSAFLVGFAGTLGVLASIAFVVITPQIVALALEKRRLRKAIRRREAAYKKSRGMRR